MRSQGPWSIPDPSAVDGDEATRLVAFRAAPVTAVFRARPVDVGASVALDFESSEHAWVARSRIGEWVPKVAFVSMARAIDDWASDDRR